MPDTALFALVEKVVAARRARDDAGSRWAAACKTDPDLTVLSAAFEAADTELDALVLALVITPSHTLEGALAKGAALPNEEDLAAAVAFLVRRYAEGCCKATNRPLGAQR